MQGEEAAIECLAHRESEPVDEVYRGLSLRMYCFPLVKEFNWNTNAKEYSPLHAPVVYSNQKHMKMYRFIRGELTESEFNDSEDSYLRNSEACMASNYEEQVPGLCVFSDEECARIRFNLLNDDCMKMNEEELGLFQNLSARSASWHDFSQSSHDEGVDNVLDTQGPFYHA